MTLGGYSTRRSSAWSPAKPLCSDGQHIASMKDHGITPISWTTVAAEMQRDWRLPAGQDLGRVFHDHYHSYGLLMDSFESVTAKVVKKAS